MAYNPALHEPLSVRQKRMVLRNRGLVGKAVQILWQDRVIRLKFRGVEQDAISVGNEALMRAVVTFDPHRPNPKKPGSFIKFSTYAIPVILRWIIRYANTFGSVVNLPEWAYGAGTRLTSRGLGVREEELPGRGCESAAAVDRRLETEDEGDRVRQAVALLSLSEQAVIIRLYFRGESGVAAAKPLRITRQAVQLRKLRALEHLRRLLGRA